MKVSEFEDFDQLETEGLLTGSRERSWIWFGLVVSLAIHFALCAYFYRTRFASTEAVFAPSDQTPTFKVRSITDSNLDKSSADQANPAAKPDRKSTRLNSSHVETSYAVFCLKKKKHPDTRE